MPDSRQKRFPRTLPDDPPRSRLLDFLALHCGMGAAIGIALAGVVVLTNMGNIGTLLRDSEEPFIPMLLFFASFALTFASLKMGMAVMSLPLEAADVDEAGPSGDDREDDVSAAVAAERDAKENDPERLLGRRE